jgi:hypothetical protein
LGEALATSWEGRERSGVESEAAMFEDTLLSRSVWRFLMARTESSMEPWLPGTERFDDEEVEDTDDAEESWYGGRKVGPERLGTALYVDVGCW